MTKVFKGVYGEFKEPSIFWKAIPNDKVRTKWWTEGESMSNQI
jgi:hypothetical protein